jgi:3',5'-cyclic AMP phosphodiesterase CpdA
MVLIAQISDFHVGRANSAIEADASTSDALSRAVAHLNRLEPRPDAVLCTGDLVDAGSPEEYARLRPILERLASPAYVIPGNHDDRDNLRASGIGRGYLPADGFMHYVVDVGALRIIALDTLIPGAPSGQLCAERLAWLDARLAEAPDRPTLVVQHHPPFRTGIAFMDGMALDGTDAEIAVLRRHPQVERVLCGHLHRSIVHRVANTLAMSCPSTTLHVELELRQAGGRVAMVPEPPSCLLHLFAKGELVTHTSYIEAFGPARVLAG